MIQEPLVEKIVIRTPNWLGDLVMSTAFIHAVLDRFPRAVVDLIVKIGFEQLPLPHRGEIIPFDPKSYSAGQFGKKLRHENYQKFYVLPPSFSSAWMAFQSQTPERIGYVGEFRRFLLNPARVYHKKARTQHLIQEYLDLLNSSASLAQYQPKLETTSQWIDLQLQNLTVALPEQYLTIAPGAIYGPAKQWPAQHYKTLSSELWTRFHLPIVILGTPADIEMGNDIKGENPEIHNCCGKTTLTQLIAVLARSLLHISNDSGSMHLVSALQRPQIALFGSTSTVWTGPTQKLAKNLQLNLSCSPCFKKTCRFQHYQCLWGILPSEVAHLVSQLLPQMEA